MQESILESVVDKHMPAAEAAEPSAAEASEPTPMTSIIESIISKPAEDLVPGALATTDIIVDVGPVVEVIAAHEEFPRELEPPMVQPKPSPLPKSVGGCPECKARVGTAPTAAVGGSKTAVRGRSRDSVIVGGAEFIVGGWGKYEVEKRHARWEASREHPGAVYGGRTYIGAADVVQSALSDRPAVPLKTAAEHLAKSLGTMQDVLCDPSGDGIWECLSPASLTQPMHTTLTAPSLTSDDLNEFLGNQESWTDPDALDALAEDASTVAASLGVYADALPPLKTKSQLPPLAQRLVRTEDDVAVLRLEASTTPYIETLESYQAAVAGRLDAVASVIDDALGKRKSRAGM
jgi:hypothetical protein